MAVNVRIWVLVMQMLGTSSFRSGVGVPEAGNERSSRPSLQTEGDEGNSGRGESPRADDNAEHESALPKHVSPDHSVVNQADFAAIESKTMAGMVGGKHDFSAFTGRVADACSACHVAHVQGVREASDVRGQAALELYRMGVQREVFVADRYMPGPTSLICLGCHNGTVAGSTVGTSHALLSGVRDGFDIPGGLSLRDHPIGVPYPMDRKNYRPRAMVETEGRVRLPEGRLECVSCHDPHNAEGIDKLLVTSNRRSALCLSCHIK